MSRGIATSGDVARRAGVSQSAVSRVFTPGASASETMREKVLKAASELGYRPNVVARSLRTKRTHTVGFISDEILTTPHAGAMIQGAQDVAYEHDYLLLMSNTANHPDVERRAVEELMDRHVDGVIYATMYHRVVDPPPQLASLPHVMLDARPRDEQSSVPWVVPDEQGGAEAAVEHLVAAGHQHIAMLTEIDGPPAAHERQLGYEAVLKRRGLSDRSLVVGASRPDTQAAIPDALRLLERADRPTAVFCFNDRIAAAVYIAAQRLGLEIPRDLRPFQQTTEGLIRCQTRNPDSRPCPSMRAPRPTR